MSNKIFSTSCPMFNFGGRIVEHFFSALNRNNEIDLDAASKVNDKDNLYVSKRSLIRFQSTWKEHHQCFDAVKSVKRDGLIKRRATFESALDIIEKEGRYQLGISNLYRSFDGKRISRYLLYWLYDRDICHINNNMPLEPEGETVPTDTITRLYQIVDVDQF